MKLIRNLMNKKSEMQITPLIDVVFLLLVFFMVSSTLVKKEADLAFSLPVTTTDPELDLYTIELLVEVNELGVISMDGMIFDSRIQLIEQLMSVKASADASGSALVVSIMPNDKARHGAIIPVMDACAAANVKNMSFSMAM
jgi:biopolymer transport protein ExbD